jgi:hypothetical protein
MKYAQKEPQVGDALYKYWDKAVQDLAGASNRAKNKGGFRVNFIKRATRSYTFK